MYRTPFIRDEEDDNSSEATLPAPLGSSNRLRIRYSQDKTHCPGYRYRDKLGERI